MTQEAPTTTPRWTPVLATRDHLPAIHALHTLIWGPTRSPSYFAWKLFDAPHPAVPVVAMDGERCVGLYAVIAAPLVLDRKRVLGAQSVDTMTHPDYRRQDMSVTLANFCYAEAARRGLPFVYGMPNEKSYPLLIKRLDWTHADDIVRWVRPLAPPRGLPGFLAAPIGKAIGAHARAGRPSGRAAVSPVTSATRFALPDFTRPPARCAIDKSADWFAWRYAAEPDIAYEQLILGDQDTPDALIVFNEIRAHDAPPLIFVDEWLAVSAKQRLAAMKALVALAAGRGCGSVVVYTNDPSAGVLLRGALFFPRGGMQLCIRPLAASRESLPTGAAGMIVLGGDKD